MPADSTTTVGPMEHWLNERPSAELHIYNSGLWEFARKQDAIRADLLAALADVTTALGELLIDLDYGDDEQKGQHTDALDAALAAIKKARGQ